MTLPESPELKTAVDAARAAGEVLKRYFGREIALRSKDISNLVTDADVEAERASVEAIRAAFPDDAVLGEESHHDDASSERLWIVDPLDGTTNFAHGIPHFAVSIAHYRAGQPVCGAIYNPLREDWHLAQRGGGAFHNGRQVQVSRESQLSESLVGLGFYYDRGAMMEATLAAIADLFRQNIHGVRRFGTASLDLAQVGCGMFGAFFEYELAPWDFAAGRLYVEEAGGQVTDCLGQPLPLGRSSVLASNGKLHAAVLEIVKSRIPAGWK